MKYQVAIIGGGPAGYTAAETAGKAGLSVVLFEKQNLGGVCLNEGCIPTKTLLYSAKTYDAARYASKYAVHVSEVSFDLPKIIARKQKVVRKLVLGVKGKLTAHGVNIVQGEATIIDKNTVECGGETYDCENLILCTGSETFVPPISGVDTVPFWTHRDALDNKELPASLAIIGGGVIGIEFASFFNSLGVHSPFTSLATRLRRGSPPTWQGGNQSSSGWTRMGLSLAFRKSSTGSRTSYFTLISFMARSAAFSVSAAMMATGSPTKRTCRSRISRS